MSLGPTTIPVRLFQLESLKPYKTAAWPWRPLQNPSSSSSPPPLPHPPLPQSSHGALPSLRVGLRLRPLPRPRPRRDRSEHRRRPQVRPRPRPLRQGRQARRFPALLVCPRRPQPVQRRFRRLSLFQPIQQKSKCYFFFFGLYETVVICIRVAACISGGAVSKLVLTACFAVISLFCFFFVFMQLTGLQIIFLS